MRKKGSITVFLSLILVLLFSFLMTMLEGARIRGASAYLAMVSELAGDSFLASYYYPLFQEYRLFGVDAGNGEGYLSESSLSEKLKENAEYGMAGLKGGLLTFEGTELSVLDYKTIMADSEAGFLPQIREQMVLDGLSLAVTEFFTAEQFTEAGVAGQLYRKQEEAMAETATVTKELLELMELADGIQTGKQGLSLGKDGKLEMAGAFIKQIAPMDREELQQAYENEEIYNTIADGFFRADRAAENIVDLVQEAEELEADIAEMEEKINRCEEQEEEHKKEWAELRDAYKNQRNNVIEDAKTQYKLLEEKLENIEPVLEKALEILEDLEKKQKKSQEAISAYEVFLHGMESMVSAELYEAFEGELETMKLYAGMEEEGYYVPTMKQSVEDNLSLLKSFSFKGFSEYEFNRVEAEMTAVIRGMSSYSLEGLWFTYGEITVAKQTGANVLGALGELLTTGMLELVGVSAELQSDGRLDGEALPSAVLEGETLVSGLMDCIAEVETLFSEGDIGTVLTAAGNALSDATALELYCAKYFHDYAEPSEVTKLKYEREYLLFGAKKDKTNLLYAVLNLIAIRTLFSMVSILKQPDKMAEIEAFASAVAGCTGIPVLLAVIRYGTILLWSVEEALVEVSALLLGKRLPVVGRGSISMEELLLVNKSFIAGKASALQEGNGPGYEDYLVLLSLTKSTKKKMYRALDLIQENIRYRYRDSFRIRNIVTEVNFCTSSKLKPLYNNGWFSGGNYQMEWNETCTY